MTEAEPTVLLNRWLHSHEEDTATERVYRPSDYAFPPSRGRTGFELRKDHSCVEIGISARDGSAMEACTWKLGSDKRMLVISTASGEKSLRIVELDKSRLVVAK